MASRTSNFCIDAADPYAQTLWWAKVLDDFDFDEDGEEDGSLGMEEWGLEGPDGRWAVLADPEANEFCVLTRGDEGA